ncbi:hypothetical protein SG34_018070 [Thalassomonas viridans]|uniref:Uncharacterized protein n=1 Tax=Thalassomonas viridans TaxID=137584 RepID=A0AAF0C7X8_9GAMM|nr:hypothetical protein [Thalassomonas viridans]WDE03299.1 hypothetical protein SG34_018070 [Thalassomonas viridans]
MDKLDKKSIAQLNHIAIITAGYSLRFLAVIFNPLIASKTNTDDNNGLRG